MTNHLREVKKTSLKKKKNLHTRNARMRGGAGKISLLTVVMSISKDVRFLKKK